MSAEPDGEKLPVAKPQVLSARLRRWGPLGLIVVATALAFAFGLHKHFTLSALIKNRAALQDFIDANYALALLSYASIYIALVAISSPVAFILTIVGGLMFGWLVAGSVTIVAATTGATIVFLAALTSLGATMRERAGPFLQKLADGFRENAFSYLLFLRLVPAFPFWVVNLAPALFNVPLRTYVAGTAIGIIPGTYTFAFLGAGLDSVIVKQEAANPGCAAAGTCSIDVKSLITTELLIALAALGVVSLIPIAWKRWRSRSL